MHPNSLVLRRLFTALDQHDHATMAACYHPDATFRDIAFDLRGRKEIHSMWHMICDESEIHTTIKLIQADAREGHVELVDVYKFGAKKHPPGRPVTNVIHAQFAFHEEGLIREHCDSCDAREWAKLALGGPSGFLAGRFRFLRRFAAKQMLEAFVKTHHEYQ